MKKLHYLMFITIAAMMMKTNVLQAQAFQWVATASAPSGIAINGVASDGSGNVYVVGTFDGTTTIGSLTLTALDAMSGYADAFVAKYNSAGTVLWAKSAGGSGDDRGNAICVDDSGHCYITGTFQSSATFDSDTLTTATGGTAFIAKYNTSDGSGVWANDVRTAFNTGSNAITVRGSKVCIAGWFYHDAMIGLDTLEGDTDPMLAAFHSYTGEELWGRQTGHYLFVEDAQDVAIDASGNVYYCGSFGNTSYFSSVKYPGSLAYPPQTITANGDPDFFVAMYNDFGGLLTVTHASSGTSTIATALELDAGGNVYCAGTFTGTLSVGSSSVTSYSAKDIFVLKLGSTLTSSWLVKAGNISASADDVVSGITIDGSGNPYITGVFAGFEGASWKTVFGSDTLVGFYPYDIYVAKLNSSGVFQWAEAAGSYNSNDFGNDLAEDGAGNIYVGGSLDCNFGAVGYFSHVSYSSAGSAAFLGKIKSDLHTGSVSTSLCAGGTISISYTADFTFNTGNVFTAQLSDVNGHFNSPVTIGTKSSKKSGTITATIPLSTTPGTKYRIRVIGSSPSIIGRDNGKDISIGAMPDVTVTPPGPVSVCKPATADLSVTSCSGCFYQWYKSSTPQSGATSSLFSASKTGSYKVIVTSTGCSATSALVSVTVNPQPTATISPSGTVDICPTGSVVLTASSGAGFSYKWKKGSAYITGATSSTYTATSAATYKVEITNASGCSKTSAGTKVIKTCKEGDMVSEESTESTVTLYPNPVGEKLFVNLSSEASAKEDSYSLIVQSIEVYDALGRKVLGKEISGSESSSEFSIDVSSLNSGVYFIRLTMENGNASSRKFVKE